MQPSPATRAAVAEAEIAYRKRLQEISNQINSAPSCREIVLKLKDRILELLEADRVTVYVVDTRTMELYSMAKAGAEIKEIRVPRTFSSIAGYAALSRESVRITDAYDEKELKRIHPSLKFDRRWDDAGGYRTRQVLATPILFEQSLMGVLQLINKRPGEAGFTTRDQQAAEEMARVVGIAIYNQRRAERTGKPGPFGHLIDIGLLSEHDLEAAAGAARAAKADLTRVLMEKHKIPKDEIGRSLSAHFGVPFFSYTGDERIPEDLLRKIPADFLKKNVCAPVERRQGAMVFVIDDPLDLIRVDALKSLGLAPRLEVHAGLRADILAYIAGSLAGMAPAESARAAVAAGSADDLGRLLEDLGAAEEEEGDDTSGGGDLTESDSVIVRLASQIILDAQSRGASDIHIEPNGREKPTVIRYRIDGDCVVYREIHPSHRSPLVQRFKIMASLDISERRKPQDGKIRFRTPGGVLELRVATMPTAGHNEDVVMRLLSASKPLPLDRLNMTPRNLEEFKKVISKPYGIVLCVGPTGSGKTTTLHSALGHINTADMKIWTAEDPVEISQPGLRQVQVNPRIGLTFAAALRSFLRADPDVIMVGEMRDSETAQIGVESSLTGHLVFSTLHTNSAAETVVRLLDMKVDPFSFADALLGILAQRLVRTICAACAEPYAAGAGETEEIARALGRRAGPVTLKRPKGCPECHDTGYRGRTAIHELLVGTAAIKSLVGRHAPVEEIRRQAIADGMTTLLQDGMERVLAGQTDLRQVRGTVLM
ncbi:MAG TPA: GspE/PulE family protein [Candidatus Polarisedimenticolia bacterium]